MFPFKYAPDGPANHKINDAKSSSPPALVNGIISRLNDPSDTPLSSSWKFPADISDRYKPGAIPFTRISYGASVVDNTFTS